MLLCKVDKFCIVYLCELNKMIIILVHWSLFYQCTQNKAGNGHVYETKRDISK